MQNRKSGFSLFFFFFFVTRRCQVKNQELDRKETAAGQMVYARPQRRESPFTGSCLDTFG